MLEHLDDPHGFDPSDSFRAATRRRARQLHRRRRTRRIALTSLLPVAGVVGAVTVYDHRLDRVRRIESANPTKGGDPLATGAPVNLLLLGLNAQEDLPIEDRDPTTRADSTVVLRLEGQSVSLLSIPRDLWTGSGKLNELSFDGTRSWLRSTLGIDTDHVIMMNTVGLGRLAERVRPRVRLELPVRDRKSGLDLPAGCQTLDGPRTVAYTRARHLEDLPGDPGSWRMDPSGDIGRVVRLQSLMVTAWGQLRRLGLGDLPELVDILVDHAFVDDDLDNGDLVALARRIRAATNPPATHTLPTASAVSADGAAVLSITPDDAATAAALEAVGGRLSTSAPTLPPAPVVDGEPSHAAWGLGQVSAC